MPRFFGIAFTVCVLFRSLSAQVEERAYDKSFVQHELARYKSVFAKTPAAVAADARFDVTYYNLDLRITTTPHFLQGSVAIMSISRVEGLASVTLDLMSSMSVDSILMDGLPVEYLQHPSTLDVILNRSYNNGEPFGMKIFYGGIPGTSGFGSFEFSNHAGTPWVWSLSEPYGAKDWWPCKDHPSDKADSVDIAVTCSSAFSVGSNGKLIGVVEHGDGTHTYRWQERYPISTYLVSVAITNYAQFSNWFKYSPTDSMEILNYVLPEHLASAQAALPRAVGMLQIYSDLFGLYPFIREKFGHSEFGWGGGMEHQTMTSLGGFDESLVAHELAHEWFGDMITCRTWPDIWLNEGFATYSEILYREKKYGTLAYFNGMNSVKTGARAAVGTVSIVDTSNVGALFGWNLVYAKGATVLHMLRHVLGDSLFFQSMVQYTHHPSLRFGNASTADFRSVCETVSGKDLEYFFDEWIYGESYPHYTYAWTSTPAGTGYEVTIGVGQSTGSSNPPFFTMPVDFRIIAPGWDTTVTFLNDRLLQSFTLPVPYNPVSVQLDPQGWILQQSDTLKSCIASPTALPFGPVFLFDSPAETVTVSNLSLLPLLISSVLSDDSAFTIEPDSATIAPASYRKFAVTFHPVVEGPRAGHLSFFHNAPGSPERVTASGTGTLRAYTVVSRWNLVSSAVRAFDPRTAALYPSALSPAFRYDPSGAYVIADSILCGLGYWLRFPSLEAVEITGLPVDRETVSVRAGWNLIGSITDPLPAAFVATDPPGLKSSNFFGYNGRYVVVDTILPGRGYWIKSAQDGSLILSANPSLNPASRISITPSPELPPPPPAADLAPVPTNFALQQNFPNPFNPSTVIHYSLPASSMVTLEIFDLLGKRVSLLVDGVQDAGYHEITWSGGTNVVSGVYYYRLRAGTTVATKKLILLR